MEVLERVLAVPIVALGLHGHAGVVAARAQEAELADLLAARDALNAVARLLLRHPARDYLYEVAVEAAPVFVGVLLLELGEARAALRCSGWLGRWNLSHLAQ